MISLFFYNITEPTNIKFDAEDYLSVRCKKLTKIQTDEPHQYAGAGIWAFLIFICCSVRCL